MLVEDDTGLFCKAFVEICYIFVLSLCDLGQWKSKMHICTKNGKVPVLDTGTGQIWVQLSPMLTQARINSFLLRLQLGQGLSTAGYERGKKRRVFGRKIKIRPVQIHHYLPHRKSYPPHRKPTRRLSSFLRGEKKNCGITRLYARHAQI